jgi:hypothetical protein
MFQSIRFDVDVPGQYLLELSRLSDADWDRFMAVMGTACVIDEESAEVLKQDLLDSESASDADRRKMLRSFLFEQRAIVGHPLTNPENIAANSVLSQLSRPARSAYPRCGSEVEAMLSDALSGVTHIMMLDPYFFSDRQEKGRHAFVKLLSRYMLSKQCACVLDVYFALTSSDPENASEELDKIEGDWQSVLREHNVKNLEYHFTTIRKIHKADYVNEHDRFLVLCTAEGGRDDGYVVSLGRGIMSFVESEARTTVALLPKCGRQVFENPRWQAPSVYTRVI